MWRRSKASSPDRGRSGPLLAQALRLPPERDPPVEHPTSWHSADLVPPPCLSRPRSTAAGRPDRRRLSSSAAGVRLLRLRVQPYFSYPYAHLPHKPRTQPNAFYYEAYYTYVCRSFQIKWRI